MTTGAYDNWLRAERLRRPHKLSADERRAALKPAQELMGEVSRRVADLGFEASPAAVPDAPDAISTSAVYWVRPGWTLWCTNARFAIAEAKDGPFSGRPGGDVRSLLLPMFDPRASQWVGRYLPERGEFRPAADDLLLAVWDALLGAPIRTEDLTSMLNG